MTIINNKNIGNNINKDNKRQKNNRMSDAHIRASAKYTAKTYKKKTIYIKLKDAEQVENYLQSHNLTYSQFFNNCLKDKNIIE